MIFFFLILKHDRNVIFLGNNMHEKPLGFDHDRQFLHYRVQPKHNPYAS